MLLYSGECFSFIRRTSNTRELHIAYVTSIRILWDYVIWKTFRRTCTSFCSRLEADRLWIFICCGHASCCIDFPQGRFIYSFGLSASRQHPERFLLSVTLKSVTRAWLVTGRDTHTHWYMDDTHTSDTLYVWNYLQYCINLWISRWIITWSLS